MKERRKMVRRRVISDRVGFQAYVKRANLLREKHRDADVPFLWSSQHWQREERSWSYWSQDWRREVDNTGM